VRDAAPRELDRRTTEAGEPAAARGVSDPWTFTFLAFLGFACALPAASRRAPPRARVPPPVLRAPCFARCAWAPLDAAPGFECPRAWAGSVCDRPDAGAAGAGDVSAVVTTALPVDACEETGRDAAWPALAVTGRAEG
jgi:hypothetical protein